MKQFSVLLAALVVCGCTTATKKTEESITKPVVEEPPTSISQLVKNKAIRVEFIENELSNVVSEYIATHPKADYDDVASFANKKIKEHGIAFDLIALDAEPMGTETLVKTTTSERLNVGMFWEPLCTEGVAARYPVIAFKKDVWTVKYKNGTYNIRAKPVRSGTTVRIKDSKQIAEIPIPEEGFEPGGITKNGKAILARVALNAATNVWWRQQMRRDPKEEPPYLVLLISADGFEFSENEEDLDRFEDKPQRKTDEDDTYQIIYPDSAYKFRSTVCT